MTTRDATTVPGETCGACERDDALDAHENAAGRAAIAYRAGEYGRFFRRMSGWIPRQQLPPNEPSATRRPLAALTVRDDSDPALALVDAWACALDVLTFYGERIANEGFLRTATERSSVLELARAIGYELGPGVAASTRLSFTLLATPSAPTEVALAAGLQVQSVPGPGELPQTFETVETVVARPVWNAPRPAQREPHPLVSGEPVLYLDGLSTGLRPGDKIVVVGDERLADAASEVWEFRTVLRVELDTSARVSKITLTNGLGWRSSDGTLTIGPPAVPRVYAFGKSLNVFGHSAPDPRLFDAGHVERLAATGLLTGGTSNPAWTDFAPIDAGASGSVEVVGEHPDLVDGGWVALTDADDVELYRVARAQLGARTAFSLSLKVTRLALDTADGLARFDRRSAVVYAASRELVLATRPIAAPVCGCEIVLEEELPLLDPGRAIFVVGPPAASGDAAADTVEVALIERAWDEVRHGELRTVLALTAPLASSFDRTRTRGLGNVARATHGKTVSYEVLGSGDGSQAFQTFTLRQLPLTYVSDASGIRSTLSVRVGGVAWSAVSSTYRRGADEQVFVPRIGDEGTVTLTFGDGVNGARLPTGTENVSASYRTGLGSAGAVSAGKLSVLKTRPMGVKAVVNPRPATGAEDPEKLADARRNAPVTVLTLDRLVSVSDYEDYARAYPGIGKAQAVRLWDGRRYWVHLTLATSEGSALTPSDALYQSFVADIEARRDPVERVWIDSYEAHTFKLRASVVIDRAYVADSVLAALAARLGQAFSFVERSFGEPITGAEILAVCHRVAGVVAVDLDALFRDDEPVPGPEAQAPSSWILPAYGARWDGGVKRAELLLLGALPDAAALVEKIS